MRIFYLGNFSQRHCTEVHLAATLEDLGHIVVRLQENGITRNELSLILAREQFDLLLFTRTWGETLTLDHLQTLRQRGIPSASYHLDLYLGLERKELYEKMGRVGIHSILDDPFWKTDFVFTVDGDPASAAKFKELGINHFYIKPGVYKKECYLVPGDKKNDVIFVGGGVEYGHPEWPYRKTLVTWLADTYGDRYKKFGWPQATVRNEELNRLYSETKVVIGDSICLNFNHTYYWSDRVYETLGRGGFIIHPYIKGMEEEFTDGVNIVFYEYGNFGQLKSLIDYYLEQDQEREQIRAAGQAKVINDCTYNNRLAQMLEIVEKREKNV